FSRNCRSGSSASSWSAKSSSAEKVVVINQQQTSNAQPAFARLRRGRRLTSNAQFMLSTLNYQLSTGSWGLHELDRCAVGVADVNDAFADVGTALESLRLACRAPA